VALVNSTVERQVIGLKDMYGSNNNDLYLCTIKVQNVKLAVERKENVVHSQFAHLSLAIHYSGIHTRRN